MYHRSGTTMKAEFQNDKQNMSDGFFKWVFANNFAILQLWRWQYPGWDPKWQCWSGRNYWSKCLFLPWTLLPNFQQYALSLLWEKVPNGISFIYTFFYRTVTWFFGKYRILKCYFYILVRNGMIWDNFVASLTSDNTTSVDLIKEIQNWYEAKR